LVTSRKSGGKKWKRKTRTFRKVEEKNKCSLKIIKQELKEAIKI